MARENLPRVIEFVIPAARANINFRCRREGGVTLIEYWDEEVLGPQPDEDEFLEANESAYLAVKDDFMEERKIATLAKQTSQIAFAEGIIDEILAMIGLVGRKTNYRRDRLAQAITDAYKRLSQ